MDHRGLFATLGLAIVVALGLSAVAPSGSAVGWEAESMDSLPPNVAVVSDANASSGEALSYTARSRADKLDQRFSTEATVLEVRARAVRKVGSWPTMNVYLDGTTSEARIATAMVDSTAFATYRFEVNVPAGLHDVHVKAQENMGRNQNLVVDWLSFSALAEESYAAGGEASNIGAECREDNGVSGRADVGRTSDACQLRAPPVGDCDKFSSAHGDDAGSGALSDPYATVDRLAKSLVPGQVGCVRGGVYDQSVSLVEGGRRGRPITVMEYPGESVEIRGSFKTNAAWVTVSGFRIDGGHGPVVVGIPYDPREIHTRPAVEINASHTRWVANDISNRRPDNNPDHAGQGISISEGAVDTMLVGNRIHHAGQLPPDNHQHCIYASKTSGLVMRDNKVYECADRGLQLYPDADNSLIEGNIFAYTGDVAVSFSGRGTQISENNLVRYNVITHSKGDWNVDAFEGQLAAGARFPQGQAKRNEVVNNCVFPGSTTKDSQTGGIESTSPGDQDYFRASGNLIANPMYKDPASGDFTLAPGSPCSNVLNGGG